MKATDLRIGNLVKVNGVQYVVDTLSSANNAILISQKGAILTTPLNEVEPISLTEEIILMCPWFNTLGESGLWWLSINESISIDLHFGVVTIGHHIQIPIENAPLHRLQNIVFDLTGEELTYKP